MTPARRELSQEMIQECLEEFPIGAWHENQWNDWIAKHCETIRKVLNDALWNFDMDAAPRDGTVVLLLSDYHDIGTGMYLEGVRNGYEWVMTYDGGRIICDARDNYETFTSPKAWRHLPAPVQDKQP